MSLCVCASPSPEDLGFKPCNNVLPLDGAVKKQIEFFAKPSPRIANAHVRSGASVSDVVANYCNVATVLYKSRDPAATKSMTGEAVPTSFF